MAPDLNNMKNTNKSIKLSFCIPHTQYYHNIVDMFELNNIIVKDLNVCNKHGHVVELEIEFPKSKTIKE